MKTIPLYALTLALATLTSTHASPLVQAIRYPGFVANPQLKTFILDSSGEMSLISKDLRKNTVVTVELGQLSKFAIDKTAAEVKSISPQSKLIDESAGRPLCTDAPSTTTVVFINGQPKEIQRNASCHNYRLDTNEGSSLGSLANFFLSM